MCHLVCAPLTLTDVPGVIGSCHPGLLVVTWATVIAALATRVVLTFTAELLCEKQREDGRTEVGFQHKQGYRVGVKGCSSQREGSKDGNCPRPSLQEWNSTLTLNAFDAKGVTLAEHCFAYC